MARPPTEWFDHALQLTHQPGRTATQALLAGRTLDDFAEEFLHRVGSSHVRPQRLPGRPRWRRGGRGYLLVDQSEGWWLTTDGAWRGAGTETRPPDELVSPILIRMALTLGVLVR